MADKTITEQNIYVTGKAYYCCTRKPKSKGKFGVGKYALGITDFDESKIAEELKEFIKEFEGVRAFQVNNSKFPFRMYDENGDILDEPVSIPNGTNIRVAFAIKESENFKTKYLSVEGIKILDEVVVYNPFENDNE